METPKEKIEENRFSKAQRSLTNAVWGFFSHPKVVPCEYLPEKYSYIFRKKSRWELTRISAIVTGIEFCYAAETAYVNPILLSLGLNVTYVSMIWCLSPLIAFILTPVLGSFSDSCRSRFGRRRPFIFLLSMGIIIGLVFIPFGGRLGLLLGDMPDAYIKRHVRNQTHMEDYVTFTNITLLETTKQKFLYEIKTEMLLSNQITNDSLPKTAFDEDDNADFSEASFLNVSNFKFNTTNYTLNYDDETVFETNTRVYGIILTVIGTVFLDFCADVCQSPCRAYLLDITLPEDHATGLTIFCLNSGLGCAIGYVIAAIKWDIRFWGNILEGQIIVSFTIISILYLLFLGSSLYSFPEIPLPLLSDPKTFKEYQAKMKDQTQNDTEMTTLNTNHSEYSTIKCNAADNKFAQRTNGTNEIQCDIGKIEVTIPNGPCAEEPFTSTQTSLKEYLKSIIFMPKSLRILCLTNFFYGMGIMSYVLFFTDFVGECIFKGDPRAAKDSKSYEVYKEGVRFGCWGMAFSALSCAVYSSFVEDLAEKFGARTVFMSGAIVYSAGMVLMAVLKHRVAVILLSSTAGIMFTTLATLPYILVAHYHSSQKFQENSTPNTHCTRGLGTDVATVISVIVLSQCILSFSMGSIVEFMGSSVVVPYSAAIFSACGAISATQVMYLDL